jgi:hypothetical protein
LEKLSSAMNRHSSISSIDFTILSANQNELTIEVTQNQTNSGKYATDVTLAERTKVLFGKYFPNATLNIIPVPFLPSPAGTVTTAWLEQKMQQKGVRIKQIAFETGIDRESISDWITGKRKMSQIVKAMFYFYLNK